MHAIVVDDNAAFVGALEHQGLPVSARYIVHGDSDLERLARQIIYSNPDEKLQHRKLNTDTVMFINISLKTGEHARPLQNGIKLLIWLRLKDVINHCVLYSFETAHALLSRAPQNLILASTGTTFVRLPFDFTTLNLNDLAKVWADEDNLKLCLKPLCNIEKVRHKEANWWGVKALWDAHHVATECEFDGAYPDLIQNQLREQENAVVSYVYRKGFIDSAQVVAQRRAMVEQKIVDNEREASDWEGYRKEEVVEKSKKISSEIQACRNDLLMLSPQNRNYSLPSDQIREIADGKKDELGVLQNQQEQCLEVDETINSVIQNLRQEFSTLKEEYKRIATTEKSRLFGNVQATNITIPRGTKIFFIDDKANDGWLDIFQVIFPVAKMKAFVPAKPSNDDYALDEIYQPIKQAVAEFDPAVIMLDLRLFDEQGNSLAVDEFSGVKVLSALREDFKGIPILLITASNKVWTYEKLTALGADAFWVKEGVDERRDAHSSAANYCRLISLMQKMTGKHYRCLRQFADLINTLRRDRGTFWWDKEGAKWANGETIDADFSGLILTLEIAHGSFRQYLRTELLMRPESRLNEFSNVESSFHISGLVNKIAGCSYEFIHGEIDVTTSAYVYRKRYGSNTERRKMRSKLRKFRADASHAKYISSVDFDCLQDSLECLCSYLTEH